MLGLAITGGVAAYLSGGCCAQGKHPVKKPSVQFFVAADGSDGNPGSREKPFATPERARDEIRRIKKAGGLPEGGVAVFVRGGTYALARTFQLTEEDAGTEAAPVVYRAYGGEKPVLTGGRRVAGFLPYKGGILKADVASQGLKDIAFHQLFVNGARQPLARYPNADPANPHGGGFAYVDGEVVSMYKDLANETCRVVRCKPEDVRRWEAPQEGQVFIYPRYNWRSCLVPIAAADRDKRQITLARDVWVGQGHTIRAGDRYYVRNLFEELDAPGEWYLDRATWTLYFWPPSPLKEAEVCVPAVGDLVRVGPGAAWITVRGFGVECCEGTGVAVTQSTNCVVAGNRVRGIGGGAGIEVVGGKNCSVVGNDVWDTCHQGIVIRGGDPETLAPGGHVADNNYVHHIGALDGHGCGIMLNGVGLRVSHNLIHDTPRCGIFGGGNDCVVEYNHIRHVNLETEDTGGYYNGGCWHVRGQIIRHNLIHDVLGYGRKPDGTWGWPHSSCCIYLDDDHSGSHVYGNILARSALGGVFVHAGRDNLIENNIIVGHGSRQVTYSGHDPASDVVAGHLKVFQKYKDNPAYAKYPEIGKMDLETAWRMVGNRFIRNIVAYRDAEAALYGLSRNDFPEQNEFDHNLIHAFGHTPKTGLRRMKGVKGPNLLGNAGFEEASSNGQRPARWSVRDRLPEGAGVSVSRDASYAGAQALLVSTAACTNGQSKAGAVALLSDGVPAVAGENYRLRVYLRAKRADTMVRLAVQTDRASGKNWQGHVPESTVHVGTGWAAYELCFRLPGEGDPWHEPAMKTMRARVTCLSDAEALWIDEASLHAVDMSDEWASWQAAGFDTHSVLADPLFVDAEKGDYRLRPGSPAFKLGFRPILSERMGPYKDSLRATWPIVEAAGVRETGLPGH